MGTATRGTTNQSATTTAETAASARVTLPTAAMTMPAAGGPASPVSTRWPRVSTTTASPST